MFKHNTDWKTVPLPARMLVLPRDPRGMPVPNTVLRTPKFPNPLQSDIPVSMYDYHFAINDRRRLFECATHDLCSICGQYLNGDAWVIGGPLSAFMPEGIFADLPVHQECGKYALKVCPYLAVPSYVNVKDVKKLANKTGLTLNTLSEGNTKVAFFVFAKLNVYKIRQPDLLVIPDRTVTPVYHEVQYWHEGEQITKEKAVELHKAAAPAVITLLNLNSKPKP